MKEYTASGYKYNYLAWAIGNNKKINGKDPIIYAMENKLSDSLIWALKNKKQIRDKEPFNWLKANKNNSFVREWLQKFSIDNLYRFRNCDDLIKHYDNIIKQIKSKSAEHPVGNKGKNLIGRLTKAVEGLI